MRGEAVEPSDVGGHFRYCLKSATAGFGFMLDKGDGGVADDVPFVEIIGFGVCIDELELIVPGVGARDFPFGVETVFVFGEAEAEATCLTVMVVPDGM